MSPEDKQIGLNNGPLLDQSDQVPYRLTDSVDKLMEMDNKRLEQQTLAESLLKTTKQFVYRIDKPRTCIQQIQPISINQTDSAENNHETLDKHKNKKFQTSRGEQTRSSN